MDIFLLLNDDKTPAAGEQYSREILLALFCIGAVVLIACCLWVYVIRPTKWKHFNKGWIQNEKWRNFFNRQLESRPESRVFRKPSFKISDPTIPFAFFDYVYVTKNNVYIFTKSLEHSITAITMEKNSYVTKDKKERDFTLPKEYDIISKHAYLFRKTFKLDNIHLVTLMTNDEFKPLSKKNSINIYFANKDDVLAYIEKNEKNETPANFDYKSTYETLLKSNFSKRKRNKLNIKNSFFASPY